MQSARLSFLFPRKIKQTEPQAQSQKKQRRKQEKRKLINNWGYENAMKMDERQIANPFLVTTNKQTKKHKWLIINSQKQLKNSLLASEILSNQPKCKEVRTETSKKDNTSSHCLIYDFLIATTNLWGVQTGVANFVVRSWRNYGIREI